MTYQKSQVFDLVFTFLTIDCGLLVVLPLSWLLEATKVGWRPARYSLTLHNIALNYRLQSTQAWPPVPPTQTAGSSLLTHSGKLSQRSEAK